MIFLPHHDSHRFALRVLANIDQLQFLSHCIRPSVIFSPVHEHAQ